jgi:glutathione peroxidase-family protein
MEEETLLITVEIKSNPQGWLLEVINTITGKTFLCQNLEEMNEQIETLYSLYPDHELQVMWLPSHEAKPEHVEEIRMLIDAIQQQLNEGSM